MEKGGSLCEGLEQRVKQAAQEEEEVGAARLLTELEGDRPGQGSSHCLPCLLPQWLLPTHPEVPALSLLEVIAVTVTISKVPTLFPQQLGPQTLSPCVTSLPGAWGLGAGGAIGLSGWPRFSPEPPDQVHGRPDTWRKTSKSRPRDLKRPLGAT